MVKDSKNQVYQFKITLLEITPQIWRRIQVPATYTLSKLHVAIQNAMGWGNCHLYQFFLSYGEKIPENNLVCDIFCLNKADSLKANKITYEYDFGDSWMHEVLLEKISTAKSGVKYPVCLEGKRACPPEDCGGTPGYLNLIDVMKNPRHKDYRHMLEWLGSKFYPEKFDPKDVCLDE